MVPVDDSARMGRLAEVLASVGRRFLDRNVRFVDALGATPMDVQGFIEPLRLNTQANSIVIAVDPIDHNPAAIPIIQAASVAILVARMAHSQLSAARRTCDAIGHHRVIGTIVLN